MIWGVGGDDEGAASAVREGMIDSFADRSDRFRLHEVSPRVSE